MDIKKPNSEQYIEMATAGNKNAQAKVAVKKMKSEIDDLVNQRHLSQRATEFLHNASWHLTQALKSIDEVKK